MKIIVKYIFIIYFCTIRCWCMIHNLEVKNDTRKYIPLSMFGFLAGGNLEVKLTNFHTMPDDNIAVFGFSLIKTTKNDINSYVENQKYCILEDDITKLANGDIAIYLKLNLKREIMIAMYTEPVNLYKNKEGIIKKMTQSTFDIVSTVKNGRTYYNVSFLMAVENAHEEGLYYLFFHNCPNYSPDRKTLIDFTIEIVENNPTSYLSVWDLPLPTLYCSMSMLFLLSGILWVVLLRFSRYPVYKIHWMMTVVVFLKAVSLTLGGVDYYYVGKLGRHLTLWVDLFYATHLLTGALLVGVLMLIVTRWTCVKDMFTSRVKTVFMMVVPLQILTDLGRIMVEESQEGAPTYRTWRFFVLIVDALWCCFMHSPFLSCRSTRTLLRRNKKLYYHIYVMIVAYIYAIKVMVYLLDIMVPFQYGWVPKVFYETVSYIFFVLTAYKFRPASQNPYFAENYLQENLGQVITEFKAAKNLKKVDLHKYGLIKTSHKHKLTLMEVTAEEKDILLAKESSHEDD